MLRVGLTGNLGSGKSTAAHMFAALGAHILNADELGRELMQPGKSIHAAIAHHFGPAVVLSDGTLDRAALARIAFTDGRLEELNAIVHPAVIERQMLLCHAIERRDPDAVVIVESALIFETKFGETKFGEVKLTEGRPATPSERWQHRFDRIILVTAPEGIKIARFIARSSPNQSLTPERRDELEAEAHRRLAQQIPDDRKSSLCDYILANSGARNELEWQVDRLWPILQSAAGETRSDPGTRYNR